MNAPMQWDAEQSRALDAVHAWLKDPHGPQVFRMFGYAGTGKTTLARHLAAQQTGTTLFAAFTGKAASVLREKGCANARTLHSLIYRLEDTTSTRPRFTLDHDSDLRYARLLIIDEVSMVDRALAQDILSFKKRVLVLGDPAQLPPVSGAGFFTNSKPDIMLTEIHRQARDNPIIRVATLMRQGEPLAHGHYDGAVRRITRAQASDAFYASEAAGQILCGRNDTRRTLNHRVRTVHGRGHHQYPRADDVLVCLRNNAPLGLLNGTIWRSTQDSVYHELSDTVALDVRQDHVAIRDLRVESAPFRDEDIVLRRPDVDTAFDYGYAITVHKAQGSQWDNVTLHDDGFGKREPSLRRQWLYTAVTRAAKRLTVVAS